ncbi:MAG: type VII toxin-antitoxin system MntA family adenylyltransferase antitoxin [Pseudonocardiaceae bacterium]
MGPAQLGVVLHPTCRLVGHNGLVDQATSDIVDVLTRRIRPVFESDSRVRFAYLYGSWARGDARPDSDVDLAVSLRPQGSLLDDARLHDQLCAALGRDDVDMLVVDDAPLWLQFRVVAGEVLFSRDERERIAFREYVEKAFLDFRHYHDSYLSAVRERARHGVLSGG